MNVSELVLAVQRLFGDTAEAQVTQPDIIRWLNQGQITIARRTEVLQRHSEVNVTVGDKCYPLPADYLFVRRATFNNELMEPVAFEEIDTVVPNRDAEQSKGTPFYYYLWDDHIWLYPTPDSSGTGNLDIWYIRRPALLSGNEDEPEIPAYMHEDLVQYAVMKAKELDEDWEASSLLRQDIEQRMANSMQDAVSNQKDTYPAIRALPDDQGPDLW